MASQQMVRYNEDDSDIMFINCSKDDKIDGESLSSIVEYALSSIGIKDHNVNQNVEKEKTSEIIKVITEAKDFVNSIFPMVWSDDNIEEKEKSYETYCNCLEKKLGLGEPYAASVEIKEWKREAIIKDMCDMLPQKVEKFEYLIEKAADRALAVLNTGVNQVKDLIFKYDQSGIALSEFVVLKIFKSGENLQIIPCYMKVKGKKRETRVAVISWTDVQSSMEYKQKRFIINKYQLKSIIRKVKEQEFIDF